MAKDGATFIKALDLKQVDILGFSIGGMVAQELHVGRVSHPDNTPHHRQPVAPSAIAPGVEMYTAEGKKDIPTPRELGRNEIKEVIQEFRTAAAAAIEAGADGVGLRGANGYLIQQIP
ncbi:2,4-dienoyl-CoA reductase-like NADH-dependent reductase (Old Yellow Enzyme family) [Virgibacillus halotolerans]|nr:2,4-dienoyl-CoA reductase-like NADH-dependent reductase (Old Yellow Enzyme family) [Virgibacillus halotolerans]